MQSKSHYDTIVPFFISYSHNPICFHADIMNIYQYSEGFTHAAKEEPKIIAYAHVQNLSTKFDCYIEVF